MPTSRRLVVLPRFALGDEVAGAVEKGDQQRPDDDGQDSRRQSEGIGGAGRGCGEGCGLGGHLSLYSFRHLTRSPTDVFVSVI